MKKKNIELLTIIACIVLVVVVILALSSMSRSAALILLGTAILYLSYKHIKGVQRYKIRSFAEIIDNVLSSGWNKQLVSLAFVTVVAFLVSWILVSSIDSLYWDGDERNLESGESFWLTICYFFDPGNLNLTNHREPGPQGLVSLIVAVLGMTILTGLFISTFTNIIEQRVNAVKNGLATYKHIKGHSVVIGFCELTESVLRGILEASELDRKVILLTNHDMDLVRKSMYNLTQNKEYDGKIVLYSGDYRYIENLSRLNLGSCKSIYILGDDEIASRDFENIACSQRIFKLITEGRKESVELNTPVPMYVRMDRMPSFSTLQRLDIQHAFISSNIYFRSFNYYEHWTRLLWVKNEVDIYDIAGVKKYINYPSLAFDLSDNKTDKSIHLVVSGFSQMGMALVLHALRAAHFCNFTEKNNLKTKITIVDPNLSLLKPLFLSQYQHIEQIYDIELDYRDCILEEIGDELKQWCLDEKQMLTIAICLNDTDTALSQSLNLPLEAYYQKGRNSTSLPRILVLQHSLSGIWNILDKRTHEELLDKESNSKSYRKGKYNKYHNVYPFGMMVSGFYPDDLDDLKACLVHIDYEDKWLYADKPEEEKISINRIYQLVQIKDTSSIESLVSEALKRWHVQSENVKWANRYQIDNHHILKELLRESGIVKVEDIETANKDAIARCSDVEHRRWVGERVVSGWQQSPFIKDGKPMRQDSLFLHYDITQTSNIGSDAAKDVNVVRNVLMLDAIYDYIKTNISLIEHV